MVQGGSIRCPYCRKETRWEANPHRPFCSDRCRQADLGNWAMERYRVAGEPVSAADLDPEDDEPDLRTRTRKS